VETISGLRAQAKFNESRIPKLLDVFPASVVQYSE
jgi:hypothetical protein